MNKSPEFTIITVTYNAAPLLQSTIDSLAAQTHNNYEYIVIDGASKDGTIQIIERNSTLIDHWISEPDGGIYDAMNKGLSLAKGQWVNFMNAGDVFTSASVLASISAQASSSSDVVFGNRNYIRQDGSRLHQRAKPIASIFERMPFGHQSTFVKNEILKTYEFNDTYKFAADYDLIMRLYNSGKVFQYIDTTVCDFLAGGQSESGIRPYIEAIKILLDNTRDPAIIQKNQYLRAFQKEAPELLTKLIGTPLPSSEPEQQDSILQKLKKALLRRNNHSRPKI